MGIPESGKVSIDDIRNEYADCKPDPTSMSDFYNGGTFVGGEGGVGVPTTGPISMGDFRGKSGTWNGTDGIERWYYGCYNLIRLGEGTKTGSWTGTITLIYTITFVNRDEFFDKFSEIQLTASHAPDVTNEQNTSMQNLLATVNARFDVDDYNATGTGDREFYSKIASGTYSSDKYSAKARRLGTTQLVFTVSITETADGVVNQPVSGTTSAIVDSYNHVDLPVPSYGLITPLFV